MALKACSKCKAEKDSNLGFHEHKSGRYVGHPYSQCKQCARATTKAWEQRNPERMSRYVRKHAKVRRAQDPERSAKYERTRTLRRHGQSADWLDETLKSQNGVCAICGRAETSIHPITGRVTSLAIDHNHETSQVRGLLCRKCNVHLHAIETIPGWAAKAALYLERFAPELK